MNPCRQDTKKAADCRRYDPNFNGIGKLPRAFRISGLKIRTSYAIRVQALNKYGGSEFSYPIMFSTGDPFRASKPLLVGLHDELVLANMTVGVELMSRPGTHDFGERNITMCEHLGPEHAYFNNKSNSKAFTAGVPDSPEAPQVEEADAADQVEPLEGTMKLKWALPPPGPHGAHITHFIVQRDDHNHGKRWVQVTNITVGDACATLVADDMIEAQCSALVKRVHRGLQYRFRVLAANAKGSSGFGPIFDAHLSGNPDNPFSPILLNHSSTSISVEWVAPHNNGAGIRQYQLQISAADDLSFSRASDAIQVTGVAIDSRLTHTFDSLLPGKNYAVRVRAFNLKGWGHWSPPETFATRSVVPPPPTISSARREADDGSIVLQMSSDLSVHSTSHIFALSETSTSGLPLPKFALFECAETDNSSPESQEWKCTAPLDAGAKYVLWAQAVNEAGASVWSTGVSL